MKVIIAEDDLVSRTVLEGLLKKSGYDVVGTYSSGKSALATLAQNNDVNVAILDWLMPEMSGIDVCTELMKKGVKQDKYVIIVSTQSGTNHVCQALESGADDYMPKPYNDAELVARLKVAFRHVGAIQKIKKYTGELEELARRNNLLGQLAGKTIGATTPLKPGAPGTTSPSIPTGISPALANLKAAVQFEATVKSTIEGLGVSDLSVDSSPNAGSYDGTPAFVAWAPLVFPSLNLWAEIVLEITATNAKKLIGQILDEENPSNQSINDMLAEFANVMRGSSKKLCEQDNLEVITPYVPRSIDIASIKEIIPDTPSKRTIYFKQESSGLRVSLIETGLSIVQKKAQQLGAMDIVFKAIADQSNADQVLVPRWTILNPRLIDRIDNFVHSETAADGFEILTPSPITQKIKPTV